MIEGTIVVSAKGRLDFIHKFSSHQLLSSEKDALSFGLDFRVPPNIWSAEDVNAEFEITMSQLSEMTPTHPSKLPAFKCGLVHLANKVSSEKPSFSALSREHLEAMNDLRKKTDIIITKLDEGSSALLLDKRITLRRWKEP